MASNIKVVTLVGSSHHLSSRAPPPTNLAAGSDDSKSSVVEALAVVAWQLIPFPFHGAKVVTMSVGQANGRLESDESIV